MGSLKRKSPEEGSSSSWEAVQDCVHHVSYPDGYIHASSSSSSQTHTTAEPAKNFPFPLDPFQSKAIICLENRESVLVSAHTSAGKTVVALYAIAMSLRNGQRVIYTSPIKALSNQKYREFKEEFSDVGLMTGDVTIDPNASCLVMTTEIWRRMQYKGYELTREVAWIVFDEVHYMRDRERGVVWEESIVLSPKNSRFVFLSATVPNAKEFVDWVVFCMFPEHQCSSSVVKINMGSTLSLIIPYRGESNSGMKITKNTKPHLDVGCVLCVNGKRESKNVCVPFSIEDVPIYNLENTDLS